MLILPYLPCKNKMKCQLAQAVVVTNKNNLLKNALSAGALGYKTTR